jgi:sulfur carrier protein ThiS
MSEHNTHDSANQKQSTTTKEVAGKIRPVQNAVDALEDDVPNEILRRLGYLVDALEAVEDWAAEADPHDINAIAGVKTIVDAEQVRVDALRSDIPSGRQSVDQKFQNLEDRLTDLADTVDDLEFTTTAYVVYVNKQFVARYDEDNVDVATILKAAGKEDPEELGLFPLDSLYGDRQEDQAFPADRELDLSEENRKFFESTSDGGKIAYE